MNNITGTKFSTPLLPLTEVQQNLLKDFDRLQELLQQRQHQHCKISKILNQFPKNSRNLMYRFIHRIYKLNPNLEPVQKDIQEASLPPKKRKAAYLPNVSTAIDQAARKKIYIGITSDDSGDEDFDDKGEISDCEEEFSPKIDAYTIPAIAASKPKMPWSIEETAILRAELKKPFKERSLSKLQDSLPGRTVSGITNKAYHMTKKRGYSRGNERGCTCSLSQ